MVTYTYLMGEKELKWYSYGRRRIIDVVLFLVSLCCCVLMFSFMGVGVGFEGNIENMAPWLLLDLRALPRTV